MSKDLTEKDIKSIEELLSIEIDKNELEQFYKAISIMNPDDKIYEEKVKKLHEIANYSFHIDKCLRKISKKRTAVLLDCACGNSYLSFFTDFILRKKGRNVEILGVDSNEKLIEKSNRIKDNLKFENMSFYTTNIKDFSPSKQVDIIYSLHACDTATDETIKKGIGINSKFIIAVPCCQREVSRNVKVGNIGLKSLRESKPMKDYFDVAITETLRKLALESHGYKVDAFEFIPTTYTPKNIMFRAEKIRDHDEKKALEYLELVKLLKLENTNVGSYLQK